MAEDVDQPPIRAAGGVVWRPGDEEGGGVEVAVIHRPQYDDWSFPKGKLAPGESEVEGAIREVFEETGLRVHLGRPLGETRYQKASGRGTRQKVVRYWAMRADGGSFSATREVDELRWVSLDDARSMLTHDRDRSLLDRFVRGPQLAGSVLLVRHASAGNRSSWEADDKARPLDDIGWRQAEGLVRLLSRYEVENVVSADYVRCVQTVQPLANALGLVIKPDTLFSETGYPGEEEQAVAAVRGYGAAGSSTVISSQGDVIPDLLERLATADHVDVPLDDPKKGSVSALTFDSERLFSIEYFPPPKL